MNTVLLSAGAACVIAAVVGGGLKAFNVEVPVVSSLLRQSLLFVVGAAFLVSAWVLRDSTDPPNRPDEATIAYHQLVAGACERIVSIRTAELPLDVIDVSATGIRFPQDPTRQGAAETTVGNAGRARLAVGAHAAGQPEIAAGSRRPGRHRLAA